MKTIVEPKEHIEKLWGKQRIRDDITYRMMQYVLRVEHNGIVLLHNVVTGRLVVLDKEETVVVKKLPQKYEPVMEQLVADHYLVPDDYDEHQQVANLRSVLLKLNKDSGTVPIVGYTILPTTACNARCYYCFEKGSRVATMSEETAEAVVAFIVNHCDDNKRVFITWFGGEPTVAAKRIDQICEGLQANDIRYASKIITNGYLLDESMITRASELWHLRGAQICVDGTEQSYNKAKAYVAISDNPYQRVMRNIGALLQHNIKVGLRMNFDLDNWQEFKDVIHESIARFGKDERLTISAHPVIGSHKNHDGKLSHGSDEWFDEKTAEMMHYAREVGVCKKLIQLPFLNYEICSACNEKTVTITPEGWLVRCPEKYGSDQITGNVVTGVTNRELVDAWKQIADFSFCHECEFFPNCVRLVNCSNTTYCHKRKDYLLQCEAAIKHHLGVFEKGAMHNGVSGAQS